MKLLLDSDFWFGLIVQRDPHHKSIQNFINHLTNKIQLFTLNLVMQETATVLSNKADQQTSLYFLSEFEKLPVSIIHIDLDLEAITWNLFKKQIKKGTSFIDCANLATIEMYKLDGILSFDLFYPKQLRIF